MQEDQSILDNSEVQVLEMDQFDGGDLVSEIIQDLSLEDVLGDRFGRYSEYLFKSVHCQMFA